jgi:hypothetical protein
MNKSFKVDVDTGEILAIVRPKKYKHSFPIKKGKYKITLTVEDCWRGRTTNYEYLDVKTDSYIAVGDSGAAFLNENEIENLDVSNIHKKGCFLSTGGDGRFKVDISVELVSKITENPHKALLNNAKVFFKTKEYNDETEKEFVEKFLHNCYSYLINDILMFKQLEKSKKMLQRLRSMSKEFGKKKKK